jgi:tetratricopeptide (TPR) repeat protein/tRNA A-37 threonylcarbamoyl transferase component Bud32
MATFPQSARAVFDEAVEIASPDERRDYLERACADAPILRQEVEALLSAYADAGSFLETPAAPPGDSMNPRPRAERPGTLIGRYKLLQQIGEGGMGVVWLAEQTEPVQRRVALKVIKPGMDSKQVIARFEAERQALAVMDHVNIARVLDGGATDAGLPYFVMELVHGVPITKYCDDHQLTPRERLELFVPVCQAIQHAHQKGIIHRDIKPSNVMVTLCDGRPVPKVIDFGVAKATEQRPSDQTLFTQCGTLVGTLEYMSPEQAEMSAQGVDTRSDIYSLGVLLYELLTGTTPLTRERMQRAAHAELLRMIKEEEPPKPSTRLSDSGEHLASISAKRDTEPAKLTKLMRGDLDWILLKCLEKDRARRYETANGLAVDILRHLHDETVTAGAPSAGYKLRKFAKRYRARVIAAGIVAGALVLGVVGTTSGMLWALNERDRANDERTRATLAAESEAKARKRAETISEFVTTALKAGDAQMSGREGVTEGAGQDTTILAAMDNAIRDIDSGRLEDDPETEAALRNTIGVILYNNGKYDRAKALLEEALALRERLFEDDDPIVAESLNNLAAVHRAQSQFAQAEPLLSRALAIYEKALDPDDPEVAYSLSSLASLYSAQGEYDQAEPLLARSLAILERAFGPDHLDVASSLTNMAQLYQFQHRYALGDPLYSRALAIHAKTRSPDHLEVLRTKSSLAGQYWSQGDLDKAVPLYEEVLEGREAKLGRPHALTLTSVGHLGATYMYAGRLPEAIPLLEEAYRASKQHPRLGWFGEELLKAYTKAADASKPESIARVVALAQELIGAARTTLPEDKPELARQLAEFGLSLLSLEAWDEAEPLIHEALTIREAHAPGDWRTFHTRSLLGGALLGQNELAEAEPLLLDSYRGMKECETTIPGYAKVRIHAALERLVRLYEAQGNEAEAAAWRSELDAALAEQESPMRREAGDDTPR